MQRIFVWSRVENQLCINCSVITGISGLGRTCLRCNTYARWCNCRTMSHGKMKKFSCVILKSVETAGYVWPPLFTLYMNSQKSSNYAHSLFRCSIGTTYSSKDSITPYSAHLYVCLHVGQYELWFFSTSYVANVHILHLSFIFMYRFA